MKYGVLLDPKSFIGSALLSTGKHDGIVEGAPVIDCASIDLEHHVFARVVRDIPPAGQGMRIPHHSILGIVEYGSTEREPFGFLRP